MRDMLRPASAEAFSLKPFSRRSLKEKLASVPCFLVCNQQGSPYLVPLETGFDVGVVFLDPADAEEMMQSMVQVRPSPRWLLSPPPRACPGVDVQAPPLTHSRTDRLAY